MTNEWQNKQIQQIPHSRVFCGLFHIMPYRVVPRQRYTVILLFVSFFCQTGWLLRRETWAPSEQTAANLSHLRWDKSTIEKVSVCWQILKQLGAMPCKYVQWEGNFKGWRPEPAQSLQEIYPLVIAYRNLVENSVYLFCYLPLHLYHSIIYYSICNDNINDD